MTPKLGTIVFVAISVALFAPTLPGAAPAISLTLSGPRRPVGIGSALKVKVLLKNVSGHPLGITNHGPGGPGQAGFYVEVRDDQGALAPKTEFYRGRQEGEDGSFFMDRMKAGETRESSVMINELYDIFKPGKYTIQVQRMLGKTVVKSNVVTVTVTN